MPKRARLIRIANRISDFFQAMPDRAEAVAGIAGHIRRYWEPRMRRQIQAHVDHAGGAGLHVIVLEALRQSQADLR